MKTDLLREQFHIFNNNRRSVLDKRFMEYGIYFGQPPILNYILNNPDSTQKEIADFLGVSPPSVATSVKRMEKSGLLMRVADKSDARRNNLQITEKGIELLQFAHTAFDEIDAVSLKAFTDEELDMLISFIERMNANLSAHMDEKGEKNA